MRIVLIFIALTIIEACHSNKDCPTSFQLPVSLTPSEKVYKIGDTISVSSIFHRCVPALTTENKSVGCFDMEGISWSPLTLIYRIDTIQEIQSIVSEYFEFIKDVKSNVDLFDNSAESSGIDGEYVYVTDTFYLAYKLVCRRSGTFLMQNGSYHWNSNQNYPGKCSGNGFGVDYQMNNGTDNHFDLLKESPDPHWNDWMVKQELYNHLFTIQGGYCFKVAP